MPSRICPRCGAKNPGWGYLCNRCGAVLEPGDVAKAIQQDIRGKSPVIIRPWGQAAALNAARTFAPEVALASPLRAILIIVLGTVALNLLRVAGTMSIITLVAPRYLFRLLDHLMSAFLSDQLALSVGALAVWVLLSLVTYAITRALGGLGSERTHYYLVAVAISSCMPIAGIVGLLWWIVALLVPEAPVWLLSGLAGGLLFFYFLTLLVQGVHTAHGESKIQETVTTGGLLFFCTILYVGLVAIVPHGLQSALLEVTRVLLLPVWR